MSIKIVIADDHGLMREGLRLLIDKEDDMEVVGEASDGRESLYITRKLKPDLVLMDVSMPNLNGIEATRLLIEEHTHVKVLALSAYSEKRFVSDILKAGASGYILKDALSEELIRAIRVIMSNQYFLSSKVAGIVVGYYISDQEESRQNWPSLSALTLKERELLQLLVENKTSKEAARILHVSIKTIDARRRSITDKLGLSGIAKLTKFAIREGLTTVDF